jgi:hypothetical protein
VLALPRRPPELLANQLRRVDLDDDLVVEIPVRVEVEKAVSRPGKTKFAGMTASAVRVNGVAERHARALGHAVDRRLRADLVEPSFESFRCVEGADDRAVLEAGERPALLFVDPQLVPAHEHMFAHPAAA